GTGTSTTGTISVTCSPKGTYSISSAARDSNAVTQSGSTSVTVAGQPVAVTVSCGSATVNVAFTCTATASGGTAPYTFTWTLPTGCTGSSTTSSISVTCSPKGSYSISSTARDGNAVTGTGSATVSVAGQPIVVTVSCAAGTAGV